MTKTRLAAALTALALALPLAGCLVPSFDPPGNTRVTQAPPASSDEATDDPTEPAAPPTEDEASEDPPAAYNASVKDWEIRLKIKSEKCYGYGLGCNITYGVKASRVGGDDLPQDGTITITYTIRGMDDGVVTESIEVELPDQTYTTTDGYGSTSRRDKKLVTKIKSVDYNPYG